MDENTVNTNQEVPETTLGPAGPASGDPAERCGATDSFLEGFDESEGSAQEQPGETALERQNEAQPKNDQQESADAPAGEQGAEGGTEGAQQQAQPETTGGNADGENAQQQTDAQPKADALRGAPGMTQRSGQAGERRGGGASELSPQGEASDTQPAPTWTLRHLDEVRQVGEADMVVLAQKGLDYDRIRGKYDESKPVMELFGQFARQANMSIPDYVSYLRTQAREEPVKDFSLVTGILGGPQAETVKQANGMSEAEAKRAVALEDREAAVSAREAEEAQRRNAAVQAAQARANMDARRSADIAEFQKLFPDAAKDPKAIPQEVWAAVRSGMTLVSAYSKYAVDKANAARQAAEQRAAAAAQNQRNTARATGSMQSAGENTGSRDPFLEGWDS